MVDLHIGLIFFHKHQHQCFISILQSMQENQDCPLGEYGIYRKFYLFPFFYHCWSFVCKFNWNQTVCTIFYGGCYKVNCFVFFVISYFSWSIAWILNFTSFGRMLKCFELFSIIKTPFAKLFTKRDRQILYDGCIWFLRELMTRYQVQ